MFERKIKTLEKHLRVPVVEKMKAIHNIECETYLPRHLTLFSRLLLSTGVPAMRDLAYEANPPIWHVSNYMWIIYLIQTHIQRWTKI